MNTKNWRLGKLGKYDANIMSSHTSTMHKTYCYNEVDFPLEQAQHAVSQHANPLPHMEIIKGSVMDRKKHVAH